MTYQIIFFDLDGTLIDPKESITKSVQYALSQFGIKAELDALIPFIGPPLNDSLKKYYGFNEGQIRQAATYYREYFSKNGVKMVEPYEGVVKLLETLKAKNKILNIVTSKYITYAQRILIENNLDSYFKDIVATSDKSLADADKPTLVKRALSLYSEQPKNSFIMVGDREHDIIGAHDNGIDSIGVLYGYGTKEEMKKIKPTHIAKTIKDLEKILLPDQV